MPLMSARPSFAPSSIGAQVVRRAAPRRRDCAPDPVRRSRTRRNPISGRHRCASGARSPDRADAAATRHDRQQVQAVEVEQAAERRQRHAGVAEPEAVDLQPQHHARDLGRHRVADADRVAEQQVPLKVVELVVGHAFVRERAEAGVDAVVGVPVRDRGLQRSARLTSTADVSARK